MSNPQQPAKPQQARATQTAGAQQQSAKPSRMAAAQQPAKPQKPKGAEGGKQRMAGDAFLNGGYYSQDDKNFTQQIMSGAGGVDDSAEAQKSFVTTQQNMNVEAQKKHEDMGLKTAEKYTGFRGGDVNMVELQNRIDSNVQNFYDRAKVQEVKTFGDRGANNMFKAPKFSFGAPTEEVKSNAADIAKEYKDDLD